MRRTLLAMSTAIALVAPALAAAQTLPANPQGAQTSDQDLPPAGPPTSTGDGSPPPTTADTPESGTVTETATLLPPPP